MNSIVLEIHRVAEIRQERVTIASSIRPFEVTYVIFLDAEGQEIARVKAFMEAV